MTIRQFINAATYASYKSQRLNSPEVEPERWRKVYGNSVDAFEQQFQAEQTERETGIQRHFREEREREVAGVLAFESQMTRGDVLILHALGVKAL
jgi:hypothetical protein